MAFVNSIANWLAADGIPLCYVANTNLNNNVPVYLPSANLNFNFGSAGMPPKPRAGYIRIKSNIINKNVTTLVSGITATDGTNTANIYVGDAGATPNNLFYDSLFFFWFDWAVSNINITNIATTHNTATYDVEFAGMQ